ncbi:MAG TPA: efflux RND transporter permease subunit [Arenicellales bacterium]|nr:efflux RND transporter permease subunit [Arenicellales bacterium]
MKLLISAAFARSRTVITLLAFILIAGAIAYLEIAKEAAPDVDIPIINVMMTHEGISPEDAERLLVRTMETELQAIEGVDEIRAVAAEGYATITLEFGAGFDAAEALADVRERVDNVRGELPADTDEPVVNEVNIALFPVVTAALSGDVSERRLIAVARDLRDRLEALPGVLEVDIGGDREELMEIVVDPTVLQTYQLSFEEVVSTLQRNNRLVAAGMLETRAGQISLKVPGVIETRADVFSLPLKTVDGRVVTFGDVASVRRTFKTPEGFARINGDPAVALEIKKRVGANIIDTVDAAREIIEAQRRTWGGGIDVTYLQDQSEDIRQVVGELENNVLTAVVLVMLVIVAALGPRAGFLVGLSIPGAFLAGILVLYAMGYTLNIITLFSLILVVGMLVDGAIIVVEQADRRVDAGMPPRVAWESASRRMAWPIIASVATTLSVFVPLLFWPGMVGDFMQYLPITVIVTLLASLLMALVFIPVIGAAIARPGRSRAAEGGRQLDADFDTDLDETIPDSGLYYRMLGRLLRYPRSVLLVAVAILAGAYAAYAEFGRGVEFFPDIEPEYAQAQVRARGDLSVWEKDQLVRDLEARLAKVSGVETIYTRTLGSTRGAEDYLPADSIGLIQFDFEHWRRRPAAEEIIGDIRQRAAGTAGVIVQVAEQESGPPTGKPVQLEVRGERLEDISAGVDRIRSLMAEIGGFVDVEDTRSPPGIEWRLEVDREEAARFGADVLLLGQAVRMLTSGIQLGEYRPDDADEALDIRIRFPYDERTLDQLDELRVPTRVGQVPISNFVRFEPAPKTGTIRRVDGRRVMTIKSDVAPGLLADDQVRRIRAALPEAGLPEGVDVQFKGEAEEMREASSFLSRAFFAALFIMLIVLVTQFNSFAQTGIILSAVVFSTAGVLLGLLITGRPFGVVMGGVAVIALAGVVVNDNIVLIDTFNRYRERGTDVRTAALRTAMQRRRPVILTSVTTILGLMPMVLTLTVDLVGRDIAFGAPSAQWWTQLSSGIAGGLALATVLTLILTPCLLMLSERAADRGAPAGKSGSAG